MAHRGVEDLSPAAAGGPAGCQDLGRLGQVALEGRERGLDCVDELGVAEDVAEHRFGALVVGVELVERPREPLSRVADRAPGSTSGHGLAVK